MQDLSTPIDKCLARVERSESLTGVVSERFGLMPTDAPSTTLPRSLRFIDECLAELPALFRRGEVCRTLMDLPFVPKPTIDELTEQDLLRLNMAYGFFAYSFRYCWEDARERLLNGGERWRSVPPPATEDLLVPTEGTIARVRANVLEPWRAVWQRMGRKMPCFEADFFTRNFRLQQDDYDRPDVVGQDTCDLLFKIFSTETERTFFLGVQEVTAKFNCIPALVRMQRAMARQEHDIVVACVDEVAELWRNVVEDVFMRFDTRIDPAEWAATVGTWTSSPFPGRDGFSGMFFPAFHMLDLLIGRVRYESLMGRLILHTREELLPAWRDLFEAIDAANLRTYCKEHGAAYPELLHSLYRLQDGYQHFFLVHRRKVFAFEYQGIVTGRNSTNAGISAEIRDRTLESVYDLATWNDINKLLLDSGAERPFERLSQGTGCPFSGRKFATDAPKSYPAPIASGCPVGAGSAPGSEEAEEALVDRPELPNWRPLTPAEDGFTGVVLETLPVKPQPGDRVAIQVHGSSKRTIEGDLVGPLRAPYFVRTSEAVQEIHEVTVLPGLFARRPGAGANAGRTGDAPVLILAEGRHGVLATTLAPHLRSELFLVIEGSREERELLVSNGVPPESIVVTHSLEHISDADVATACGHQSGALRALRDRLLVYISGSPAFVRRANEWMRRAFVGPEESFAEILSHMRLSKRYRPIIQAGPSAPVDGVMRPWDVVTARATPLRVVLGKDVLDLTEFQASHYGGTPILRMLAGTDLSAEFSRAHPKNQIRMPAVHRVATFDVPPGLESLTQRTFMITRSANVIDLLGTLRDEYADSPRIRLQRLARVLLALDVEALWSDSLADACHHEVPLAMQQELREAHAERVVELEGLLTNEADLPSVSTATIAAEYQWLYRQVLENFAAGMRERTREGTTEADPMALHRCFDEHLELLRTHFLSATGRTGSSATRGDGEVASPAA